MQSDSMITVLRLGHRIGRDKRLSTHVALAARALGCRGIIYSGERDRKLEDSVKKVVKNWGGDFGIEYAMDWKKRIRDFRGIRVHLTVYGIPFQDRIKQIRKKKSVMVIVGGEKVQPEVYDMSDFNLQVTGQPHSEVSGLSLFLDHYFRGRELGRRFPKARLRVIPQEKGKKVIKR